MFRRNIFRLKKEGFISFSLHNKTDINTFSNKYYDNDDLSEYALKHAINYQENEKNKHNQIKVPEYDEEENEWMTYYSNKLARKN